MSKLEITLEMAYAAGQDAANRQMRLAGREGWNCVDLELALQVYSDLLAYALNADILKALVDGGLITQAHADKVLAWQHAQE